MSDPAPTQRLGRTALLVQGLAILSAAIVAAAMAWLGMESGEGYAIVAVASAAAGVFMFWSLMLAVRAILGGERARWPMAVVLLVLFEIAAPCLALWTKIFDDNLNAALSFMIWLGLPVFGPFVAIGSLVAAPLALWRARKAEAAESAAGVKSWRRKTWKVWLAWYAGAMVGLGIFLLPGPLFLLGATAWEFYPSVDSEGVQENPGWGRVVALYSPNFIRDSVEGLLDSSQTANTEILQARIVRRGFLSKKRLIERLAATWSASEDFRGNPAWRGLFESYPDSIPEVVDGIVDGKVVVTNDSTFEILKWIARRGDERQMKSVLVGVNCQSFKRDRPSFLDALETNGILNVMPELEKLADANELDVNELEMSYGMFADWMPAEDLERVWRKSLKNEANGKVAASKANLCVKRGLMEPLVVCLQNSVPQIRRITLIPLAVYREGLRPHLFRNPKNVEHLKLTRKLYEILDDQDTAMSLAATCVLGDIFCEGDGDALRSKIAESICSLQMRPEIMPVLDEEYRAEIAKVKAAVGKWLKENAAEK